MPEPSRSRSSFAVAAMHTRRRLTVGVAKGILAVFVLGLCWRHSHARELLSDVNIQGITSSLSQQFTAILEEGLGLKDLEKEYEDKAMFETTKLKHSIFSKPAVLDSIAELYTTIESNSFPDDNDALDEEDPVIDCCNRDNTVTEACCHSCSGRQDLFFQDVWRAFEEKAMALPGVELQFGFPNGALLYYPAIESAFDRDCATRDSRLQPWYMEATRRKPRDVIILLELPESNTNEQDQVLKQGAVNVVSSLGPQDRAGAVVFAGSLVEKEAVLMCEKNKELLIDFIARASAFPNAHNYTAFINALKLFTGQLGERDNHLIFFWSGTNEGNTNLMPSVRTQILAFVAAGKVTVSIYHLSAPVFLGAFEEDLVSANSETEGIITTLEDSSSSVANYYQPFLSNTALLPPAFISSVSNSNGEKSLSFAMVVLNDTGNAGDQFMGVFRAVVPWQHMYADPYSKVTELRLSYFFAMRLNGEMLFHPQLPTDSDSFYVFDFSVSGEHVIASLERGLFGDAAAFSSFLQKLSEQDEALVSTEKQVITLVSNHSTGFAVRTLPYEYFCRIEESDSLEELSYIFCFAVANSDISHSTLKPTESPSDIYSADPTRLPIYHNTKLSLSSDDDQCNYLCSLSTTDHISIQLVGPSEPNREDTPELVDEVISYLEGDGDKPSYVQEGVASETAIVSVVARAWIPSNSNGDKEEDGGDNDDEYAVVRRHLATPSGIYLSYPPVHLDSSFQPSLTAWYRTAVAFDGTMSLTPVVRDPLENDFLFSLSFSFGKQPGQVLSVLAADITMETIEALLLQESSACGEDGYLCVVLDNQGNLIYSPAIPEDNPDLPVFFVRYSEEYFAVVMNRLLVSSAITNTQCNDFFDNEISHRSFFSFNMDSNDVEDVSYKGCHLYRFQKIPQTNAFLLILDKACTELFLCVCTDPEESCFNCNQISSTSCACPCTCDEDCKPKLANTSGCPVVSLEDPNYRLADPILSDESDTIQYCFNPKCETRSHLECLSQPECYWCEDMEKCTHVASCCNPQDTNPSQCCLSDTVPQCYSEACQADPAGPSFPVDTEGSTSYAYVAAVVVGLLVAIGLVAMIVGLCVWYQFCRNPDSDVDSKENVFDFVRNRMENVNPVAIENQKLQQQQQQGAGEEEKKQVDPEDIDVKVDLGDKNTKL